MICGRICEHNSAVILLLVCACALSWILWISAPFSELCLPFGIPDDALQNPKKYIFGSDGQKYFYDRLMPLAFIGGIPRSGTTLLRVMLDSHPDVRCGQETRIIPRILGMQGEMMMSDSELKRLREAGITPEILNSAVAAFILEVIVRHGRLAPVLCAKDPFALRSSLHLHALFPNAKFILMLRDGRAVVHSIMTRKITINGWNLKDWKECLRRWNTSIAAMLDQCLQLGHRLCLPVHYEKLVLKPELTMKKVLNFLDLPFRESVLHHEDILGKPGGPVLSILERSTDQVIKPVNTEALTKWVGHIPEDVLKEINSIAPMLQTLGYDPKANPPNYGIPDTLVLQNTKNLIINKNLWLFKENTLVEKRKDIWRSWIQAFMSKKNHSQSIDHSKERISTTNLETRPYYEK